MRSPLFLLLVALSSAFLLCFTGCLGMRTLEPVFIPQFKEYPASTADLEIAIVTARRRSGFPDPDQPSASGGKQLELVTVALSASELRQYAFRPKHIPRGKLIRGRLTVVVQLRPSFTTRNYTRITIDPRFSAYISRIGDHRQWIEWQSRGIVERELFTNLEYALAELQDD